MMRSSLRIILICFFILPVICFCEDSGERKEDGKKPNNSKIADSPEKVLLTYFSNWTNLGTLTYKIEIDGETEVTTGTQSTKTTMKTEMTLQQWVSRTNDPKWVFNLYSLYLNIVFTINGVRTPLP